MDFNSSLVQAERLSEQKKQNKDAQIKYLMQLSPKLIDGQLIVHLK